MRWVSTHFPVEICATCGKRKYPTWRDAAQVAERQRNRQGLLVQPYHSPTCDAYHVGAPQRVRKSSEKRQNDADGVEVLFARCARLRGVQSATRVLLEEVSQ